MKSILIDAGPLIALFDKSDQYHQDALTFLKEFRGSLLTTWPVITEVSHMLSFSTKVQVNFLKWIDRGGLEIINVGRHDLNRLISLCEIYDDVPMDLADASLMVVAEVREIKEIASIDSDFYIYRNVRNQYLTNCFLK